MSPNREEGHSPAQPLPWRSVCAPMAMAFSFYRRPIHERKAQTSATNQAAIAISGGQVDLGTTYGDPYDPNTGGNTISINGPGVLIRLTGPNNVMAFGDTFVVNGTALGDNYQIENAIDHSLDGFGPGTVFWVPSQVFVTTRDISIQAGL